MPQHHKPTKEELEAQEKAALEANPSEPEPSEPAPEPELESSEPALSEPEPSEPAPEPELQTEPSEEEKEKLKKKLSASARENQKIYAKNRVINKALADAEDVPEPTEEELLKEFGEIEWDVMSDTEKMLAKETFISRKWRKVISTAKEQATKIEKWNESVEEFVDDPKTLIDNPDLESKTTEFKEFALQETNNSVPMNILVSAFLHEQTKNKSTNKSQMFERGKGGSNEKPIPKDGTITLEEGRKLRETDYNKWKEMLAAGKIKSDL
jgi:hypothetical protein